MNEIYVSTDVETDGPMPGPHSMLSFASAAYTADKRLLSTFSANLETLEGASPHPVTAKWWKTQPEAWAACRRDLQKPAAAMHAYIEWIHSLGGKPVFVAFPVGFDFMFVNWYLMTFTGKTPFGFSALDIKTFAMAVLHADFEDCTRQKLPAHWFDQRLPHTHVALDDALEQGALFCNLLQAHRARAPVT